MSMFCSAHSMMPVGSWFDSVPRVANPALFLIQTAAPSHDHVNWNTVDESAFID